MNPFKRVPLYDAKEVFNSAVSRSSKALPRRRGRRDPLRVRKFYAKARIESLYDYLAYRLRKLVESYPDIDSLDSFYRSFLEMFFDRDRIKLCLGRIRGLSRLLEKLKVEFLRRLKNATERREVYELRREALGRARDIVYTAKECLDYLNSVTRFMSRLPDYRPEMLSIVIAGPPNVGKSSIANALSTAKSEVARYPFTTRDTIFGHLELEGKKVQVIDTPGILERLSFEELTEIEKKAIAAIRGTRGILLFVFDASAEYPAEEQIRIFENMRKLYAGEKSLIAAINKIDAADEETLEKIEGYLKRIGVPYAKVSALKGYLEELLERIKIELRAQKLS